MAYNENDPRGMEYAHALSRRVFREPVTPEMRADLIEYLEYHARWARAIPEHELLGGVGAEISTTLCGALAWHADVGGTPEQRIIDFTDPRLSRALLLASGLDNQNDKLDVWRELLDIIEVLSTEGLAE